MAPKKIVWQRTVATMQATDLARDDDFLSHILIDMLAPNRPLGVHKMDSTRPIPECDPRRILTIVRELVVPPAGVKGKLPSYKLVEPAVDKLLALDAVRQYLKGKTQRQINCFATHASRYFELYLPSGQIEIASTSRYTWKTGKSELCVLATQPLGAVANGTMCTGPEFKGQKIHELKGSIADLTNKEDDELRRTSGAASRDFSVIYSHQKGCNQLFLGPARFVNHDCNPNAELFRDGKYITFRVLRPIAVGQEITASYGPDYFGKQNKHCLCATCEESKQGGYAPPGTYPETSDSEREKEFLKKDSTGLLNRSSSPAGPAPGQPPDPASPTLTSAAKTDEAINAPRRSLAPLVAVPSGVEDVAEGEHEATSCADTDGEIIDISDSEVEAEPTPAVIHIADSDADTDDGRETDDGPYGAETDAPMDISDDDSDVDFSRVKISLNPSSPPSSPHRPLVEASAIASKLRVAQTGTADKPTRLKLQLRSPNASAAASSASHTPRPTLTPSSASLPTLPSQQEPAAPAVQPAIRRTRTTTLSTPSGSAASTPPPSAPLGLPVKRASSRLNLSKDKQEPVKEQAATPPLSDEGAVKDATLARSLRSRSAVTTAPAPASAPVAGAQPSTRVTRRAFLKPAAPRTAGTGTPVPSVPAAPAEKKVARRGKDCIVCLALLPKVAKDQVQLKCFRCDRHHAIFGTDWPKRFIGVMIPLDDPLEEAGFEAAASSRRAGRGKAGSKRPSPETDREDPDGDGHSSKRSKTHRLSKEEREAKRQRKREKEARRQARAERKEMKRMAKEERRAVRARALAEVTNRIYPTSGPDNLLFASLSDKQDDTARPMSFAKDLPAIDVKPVKLEAEVLDPEPTTPELVHEEEEEEEEESDDDEPNLLDDFKIMLVPPRQRAFLGHVYRPNPHSFGRIPRLVYEDDPLLDIRNASHLAEPVLSSELSDVDHAGPAPGVETTANTAPAPLNTPTTTSVDVARHAHSDSDCEDPDLPSDLSEMNELDSEWDDYDPFNPDARSVASPPRHSHSLPRSLPSPPRSVSPDSDPDDCVDNTLPLRMMGMWRKWTPFAGAYYRGPSQAFDQAVEMFADGDVSESDGDGDESVLSELSVEEDEEQVDRAPGPDSPVRCRPMGRTYTSYNRSLLSSSRTRLVSRCNVPLVEYTGIDDEGKEIAPGGSAPKPLRFALPPSSVDRHSTDEPPSIPHDLITLRSFDAETDYPVPHEDEWFIPLAPINMTFFTSRHRDPPSPVLPSDLLLPVRAPSVASYRPVTPVSMTDPNSKSPTPLVQDGKGSSLLSRTLRQDRLKRRRSNESDETIQPNQSSLAGTSKSTLIHFLPRKSFGKELSRIMFNPSGTSSPRPMKRPRSGLTAS